MTKDELKQYQALQRERAQLEERLWELQASITAPKTAKIDAEPKGGPSGAGLDAVVARYMELEARYQDKLAEIAAQLLAIEKAIEPLEPRDRTLLRFRYIDGLTWEEVCVRMSYSWKQIHRIHGRALTKLQAGPPEGWKPPEPEPDPCEGCTDRDCHHCIYGDDR